MNEAFCLYIYISSLELPNVAAYSLYSQPQTYFHGADGPQYGLPSLIACPYLHELASIWAGLLCGETVPQGH